MTTTFHALVLEKDPEFRAQVREVADDFLGEGDVTFDVEYSTLNFKDGLAITNRSPVVRTWPMIAGIDGAGVVASSTSSKWKPGDRVLINGFGTGEVHKGCLAGRARMKAEWLVRLPERFSTKQAMAIGTAGYTAMLSVLALERHGLKPGDGEVLVTGATGGVGSVAIAVLAKLGHRVVAATGKASEEGYLKSLGAASIIDRNELAAPGKPLQKERWAGVVEALGSHTLANAAAQVARGGAVAVCGNAQGMDLPATVAPLILRGVALLGIDSNYAPLALREEAWSRLARDLDVAKLDAMTTEIPLSGAIEQAQRLMAGQARGRTVVRTRLG
jgi:acrylyl-CoA reductase (NADPH)